MTTKKGAKSSRRPSRKADHVDLDLAAVSEGYARAARLVVSLYDKGASLPDWLTDLITRGLAAATEQTGIEHWSGEDFDLRGLADLLAVSNMPGKYKLEFEQKKDLPELISAVLKHPNTPRDLYTAMRREIATMTEPDEVNESPDMLRVALAVHKAEQAEEGGAR